MAERRDNYAIQAAQAKQLFLTYDQQELIDRCRLEYDETYFYIRFLGERCRICRKSGDMERFCRGQWMDGNGYNEVMTLLDWLCDSRPDRYITGRWANVVTLGAGIHGSLQSAMGSAHARCFDQDPKAFAAACQAMGGEKHPSADVSYAIELVDGLKVLVQLWHGDEEFPPRVCCLWDENTTRYIRYETTWFAMGLLLERIKEYMP